MFVVHHRHAPEECRFAFAAWKGFRSPLRHTGALSACPRGDHVMWWTVEAGSEGEVLTKFPVYVADRSVVTQVDEVQIP